MNEYTFKYKKHLSKIDKVFLDLLATLVTDQFSINKKLLFQNCRKKEAVFSRAIVWMLFIKYEEILIKQNPSRKFVSYVLLGRYFNKDHATVYHAKIKKHAIYMKVIEYKRAFEYTEYHFAQYLGLLDQELKDKVFHGRVDKETIQKALFGTSTHLVRREEEDPVKKKDDIPSERYTHTIGFTKGFIGNDINQSIGLIMQSKKDDYNKALLLISALRVFGKDYDLKIIPDTLLGTVLNLSENEKFGISINGRKISVK
jgi:hypothetical protein